jgi:hypothetical protein
MPLSRFECHERIKAVEREFFSARIAVDRLQSAAVADPTVLGRGPKPKDLVAAGTNLEGTYVIRMFAEFESTIRSYWRTIHPQAHPTVSVLLNRVGDRRQIPTDAIAAAQGVREYRNCLVHERDQGPQAVAIPDARGHLQRFLARLPEKWGP